MEEFTVELALCTQRYCTVAQFMVTWVKHTCIMATEIYEHNCSDEGVQSAVLLVVSPERQPTRIQSPIASQWSTDSFAMVDAVQRWKNGSKR